MASDKGKRRASVTRRGLFKIGAGAFGLGIVATMADLFMGDATPVFALTASENLDLLTNVPTQTAVYLTNLGASNATIDLKGHPQLTTKNFTSATAQTQYHGPGVGVKTTLTSGDINLTDAYSIRWSNAGKDGDGDSVDVEMLCKNLTVHHVEGENVWLFSLADGSKPQFEAYLDRGGDAIVPAYSTTYPSSPTVEQYVEFRIYKHGTNTKIKDSVLVAIGDLDGWWEAARLGDGFQSPVFLRSNHDVLVSAENTYFQSPQQQIANYNTDDTNEVQQALSGFAARTRSDTDYFSLTWYGWGCHTRLDISYTGALTPVPEKVTKSPDNQVTKVGENVAFDVVVDKLYYTIAENRAQSVQFRDQLNASIDPSSVNVKVMKGTTDVTSSWTKAVSNSGYLTMTAKTTNTESDAGVYGKLTFSITAKQKSADAYDYSKLPVADYNGQSYGKYTNQASIYVKGKTGAESEIKSNTVNVYVAVNGKLSVLKKSAQPAKSGDAQYYSLAGAVYGVYKDAACTNKVAELTTNAEGKTDEVELMPATYYVKETKASKGFELDTQVYTIKVESAKSATVTSTEKLSQAGLKLQKADADLK